MARFYLEGWGCATFCRIALSRMRPAALFWRRGTVARWRDAGRLGEDTVANQPIPRVIFLLGAGTAVAAGLAPLAPAQDAQSAEPPAPAATVSPEPEPPLTLTATEAAFLSAAADTMIPADELSPCG